ncbi:MAG: DEAD/DEAH box helicase [Phototrophicaceae bacterium]
MQFQELNLIDPLLRAVREAGYDEPTPIQSQAIPLLLNGKDLIGIAQTGTGKTAAFALPILQRLILTRAQAKPRTIRALILSPTRELAAQIGESIATYSRFASINHAVIYGGVSQNSQVAALRRGVDILVATPGRLLDLMRQGFVHLNNVEVFTLDEADQMFDMGFITDIRKVIQVLPKERQTLLFSATMPEEIRDLANKILTDPVQIQVSPPATPVARIEQSVFYVDKREKHSLLIHLLENDRKLFRVLVFTRTKRNANTLVEKLQRAKINAEAIHSNKSQSSRQRALANFKNGKTHVLVATDIASRGIDIDSITHVINYDLPFEPDSYVHRIGRTARADKEGTAYSFCDLDERNLLKAIEKHIHLRLTVVEDHPHALTLPTHIPNSGRPKQYGQNKPSNGSNPASAQNRNRRNYNNNRSGVENKSSSRERIPTV